MIALFIRVERLAIFIRNDVQNSKSYTGLSTRDYGDRNIV